MVRIQEELPKYCKYKIATVQYAPIMGEKERNTSDQLKMAKEAAEEGAKLIVLTEMNNCGYCWHSKEELSPYVETVPGPTTWKYADIAKKYGCYICTGLAEVDPALNGNFYNTAVLIGPENEVELKYRKTHSFISDPKWAKDGDLGIPVAETDYGNIGIIICMDVNFIEPARLLALKGTDIVCFPTYWLWEKGPGQPWITRAFENGFYWAGSGRIGIERGVVASGGSCILNPDGSIQSYLDSEKGITYGEVDILKARTKTFQPTLAEENKFLDRRPHEYPNLTLNTYLWNPLDFFRLYEYDKLPPGKKSTIALAQFKPRKGDKKANLAKIRNIISESIKGSAGKPDLIVFPEMATTGVVLNTSEATSLAEPIPGETVDYFSALAKKYSTYIVLGMLEKEGRDLYNTAVLLSGEGIVGKYRKIHLSRHDRLWEAKQGNLNFPHFNIPPGRVGLLIGYDAMFPEAARCLALDGVDILCIPSAVEYPRPIGLKATSVPHPEPIVKNADPLHWHLWRMRAGENNVYLVFANQWGTEGNFPFIGMSGIFGPHHFPSMNPPSGRDEIVASATGDSVKFKVIDTSNLDCPYPTSPVRYKFLLRMRQTHLYSPLQDENPFVLKMIRKS
ncbi:MAG: nitrilase-related carbon-nitrogen hydrolase [Candidatus Bathyarchaeota archaeon]